MVQHRHGGIPLQQRRRPELLNGTPSSTRPPPSSAVAGSAWPSPPLTTLKNSIGKSVRRRLDFSTPQPKVGQHRPSETDAGGPSGCATRETEAASPTERSTSFRRIWVRKDLFPTESASAEKDLESRPRSREERSRSPLRRSPSLEVVYDSVVDAVPDPQLDASQDKQQEPPSTPRQAVPLRLHIPTAGPSSAGRDDVDTQREAPEGHCGQPAGAEQAQAHLETLCAPLQGDTVDEENSEDVNNVEELRKKIVELETRNRIRDGQWMQLRDLYNRLLNLYLKTYSHLTELRGMVDTVVATSRSRELEDTQPSSEGQVGGTETQV